MKNRKQAYMILILIMIIAFVCTHDESWILMQKLHIDSQKQDFCQIISAIIYFMIGIFIDCSSLKMLYTLLNNNKVIKCILNQVGKFALKALAYTQPLCNYFLKKDSDADDAKKAINLGNKKYKALLKENSNMLRLGFYGIEALLVVAVIIISLLSTEIQKIVKIVIISILDLLNLVVFIYVNYKNAKQSDFDFTHILK